MRLLFLKIPRVSGRYIGLDCCSGNGASTEYLVEAMSTWLGRNSVIIFTQPNLPRKLMSKLSICSNRHLFRDRLWKHCFMKSMLKYVVHTGLTMFYCTLLKLLINTYLSLLENNIV